MNSLPTLSLAQKLFRALPPARGWSAEVFVETGRSRDVGWAAGGPKDTRDRWSQGVSLRVVKNGRQGFAYGTDLTPAGVRTLWERSRSAAERLPLDAARGLPAPRAAPPPPAGATAFEDKLFAAPVKTFQERLKAEEKKLLRSDRRVKEILSMSCEESAGARAVVNSAGIAVTELFGSVSFSVELLGEAGRDTQAAWGSAERRFWKDVDVGGVAAEARDRLLSSFGARPLPSGSWAVVFAPRVGVEFLGILSEALSAEAVQKGRSFLKGLLNTPVAAPGLTLIDDGRRPGGLGSGRYDAEGVPTQTTVLVDGGVLKNYLYDTETAARDRRASTGNAARPDHTAAPSPGCTNFYLAPGRRTAAALIAETPKAFLVQEVLGMHTADPVTGDFSVGASGLLVEKGRVGRAVKGVTLAGNLGDLLKKIDGVGDDLTWHGALGAPTFRVRGLSIGGS